MIVETSIQFLKRQRKLFRIIPPRLIGKLSNFLAVHKCAWENATKNISYDTTMNCCMCDVLSGKTVRWGKDR